MYILQYIIELFLRQGLYLQILGIISLVTALMCTLLIVALILKLWKLVYYLVTSQLILVIVTFLLSICKKTRDISLEGNLPIILMIILIGLVLISSIALTAIRILKLNIIQYFSLPCKEEFRQNVEYYCYFVTMILNRIIIPVLQLHGFKLSIVIGSFSLVFFLISAEGFYYVFLPIMLSFLFFIYNILSIHEVFFSILPNLSEEKIDFFFDKYSKVRIPQILLTNFENFPNPGDWEFPSKKSKANKIPPNYQNNSYFKNFKKFGKWVPVVLILGYPIISYATNSLLEKQKFDHEVHLEKLKFDNSSRLQQQKHENDLNLLKESKKK